MAPVKILSRKGGLSGGRPTPSVGRDDPIGGLNLRKRDRYHPCEYRRNLRYYKGLCGTLHLFQGEAGKIHWPRPA
jgi:hypothetical protein